MNVGDFFGEIMKIIFSAMLIVVFLAACDTEKAEVVFAKATASAKLLNERICNPHYEYMRDVFITAVRLEQPLYPDEGLCHLVNGDK